MTLGDIIKDYCSTHSKAQFTRDSGLSKAYTYMLINTRNKNGEPIMPSIMTIKKAAMGMHTSFDKVFNQLDDDLIVYLSNGIVPHKWDLPKEISELYIKLPEESKKTIHKVIKEEFEKHKELINEYQRVLHLKKITSIEDAQLLLQNSAAFGGQVTDEQLIELANIVRNHQSG